jgi:spermidine synthase
VRGRAPTRRAGPAQFLLLLLFGSGCAALIYEVVWFQLLQLAIGSSAVSLGTLLGTFMGGLCLGSLLFPRLIAPRWHPIRVYAVLELGVGASGLILLLAIPLVSRLYTTMGGGHLAVRALVAGVCLLPPTAMMGATFPAVARSVETRPTGVRWLGFFYAANLVGAVAGSLWAGFYLLRLYDTVVATCVAVTINLGLAVVSFAIAARAPFRAEPREPNALAAAAPGSSRVFVAIGLSGFTALSAEVIWTRLLALAFGGTVYTFSLILGGFFVGLGLGGGLGAGLARSRLRPQVLLGWCQLLLCLAIAWAGYLLTRVIPYWPVARSVAIGLWPSVEGDGIRCLLVVLPGAILWGASFPLALAAIAAPGQDPGRLAGGVYAANTIGAIAGSLGAGLVMVTYLGSQHAQQLLIIVSGLSAILLVAPASHSSAKALCVTGAAGVALLAWTVAPVPGTLVAYGRYAAYWTEATRGIAAGRILYVGEGLNAFVAVSRGFSGELNYHAAGKVQASTRAEDMRLQRLLAHVSHLIPRHPADVLVIGCGAGITAGAGSVGPGVEHMTIVEIESLVPRVASTYFGDYNDHVIDNRNVTVLIDDGRHFLMTTDRKFDVITTDMIDPWVKGVATLFTREFFEVARQHLRPGGVVTQFVQLYQSSREAVKSEIGTFVEAFPNSIIWGNPANGQGYDLVLMGQVEPIRIDIDELQARLDSPRYARVADSLRAIGIESAVQLLSTYAGAASDLAPWLRDAAINRDRDLRLQYLAGMGVNLDESGPIYRDILRYAKYPDHAFTGSPASVQAVRDAVAQAVGR